MTNALICNSDFYVYQDFVSYVIIGTWLTDPLKVYLLLLNLMCRLLA